MKAKILCIIKQPSGHEGYLYAVDSPMLVPNGTGLGNTVEEAISNLKRLLETGACVIGSTRVRAKWIEVDVPEPEV